MLLLILYQTLISILNIIATHTMLTRKKPVIYCVFAFILNTIFIYIGVYFVQKYISNFTISKYILYFIAFTYIIYILLIFEESNSKKLFAMFSIWMFSTIILFFATSLADALLTKVNEDSVQIFVSIIRICLEILLVLLLYFRLSTLYKNVIGVISDKTVNIIAFYPVIAFLLLIKNNTVSFGLHVGFNSEFDVLLFLVFVSLGYILIFAGIYSSSKVISLQYKYRIIENQVEQQRQNYKKLSDSIELIYTIKHDIRHHIFAIKSMVEEQKNKQALEYIEQFIQSEQSKTIPTICENFAADSIIKYYMSLALNRNIDFNTNINIPEDIGINSLDLCVVLGNGLDNAIDACDKLSASERKYIEFNSKVVGTHIVFNITNSFNGKINKINERIKSSKEESGHGIGLFSIKETVNKYNGNVSYKYTEDQFRIEIIMCICISSQIKPF